MTCTYNRFSNKALCWNYFVFYWPQLICLYKKFLSTVDTVRTLNITIIIIIVSCHRHFFPVLLLNQRWSPPLTLQASHCNTFRIMCDVPSIAVFCSEPIECFPGTVSKFFLKLLVTIPVAPIITGTIVHFRFHIRFISIHKLLYFNLSLLLFTSRDSSFDIASRTLAGN